MNSERNPELPTELASLVADLASLAPASGELRRDELMYRAGWEACAASFAGESSKRAKGAYADTRAHNTDARDRRLAWLWPLSTAGLLLVSATLGAVLATRTPEVRVVVVEKPAGAATDVNQSPVVQVAAPSQDSPSEGVASAGPRIALATQDFGRPPLRRGDDYLALRQRVLAYGVEVLQSADTSSLPGKSDAAIDSRYGALLGELRGG